MLPLAAADLTHRVGQNANPVLAAAVVVAQAIVALISPMIGTIADRRGPRLVLVLGFSALPLRALLLAVISDPSLMIAVQALDGISAATFGIMVPLAAAELTRGTARFNLRLGTFGLATAAGATMSTSLAGTIADHVGNPTAFLALAAPRSSGRGELAACTRLARLRCSAATPGASAAAWDGIGTLLADLPCGRHGEGPGRCRDQHGDPDLKCDFETLDRAAGFPSTEAVTMLRSSALRRLVAGVLMAVLTLAGVGRGLAAASDVGSSLGIPGVAFHICHTGAGDGPVPANPAQHDCCDACAMCAPVTLADPPALTGPESVVYFVEHVQAMAWVATLTRCRTPRQSQGPPTA